MSGPLSKSSWETATASGDLVPFWRRHLRAQIRLYAWARGRDTGGRSYCAAAVWSLTTFLHALQDCTTEADLHTRAADKRWWDSLCATELESATLLALKVGDVPLSGNGLSKAALALRYLELTRRVTIDPTTVLDAPPRVLDTWLSEDA